MSAKQMSKAERSDDGAQLNEKEVEDEVLLVYDMQCPACDTYCRLVRVAGTVGDLKLVDARESSEIMNEITDADLDIDQGMVVKHKGVLYYGSDAIHSLALMGRREGIFNRLNHYIFRSKTRARFLYPILRSGRNLLLKTLRKTKINNLRMVDNDRF